MWIDKFLKTAFSGKSNAISRVRLSVRLFSLCLLKRLSLNVSYLVCLYMWVMTIARLKLKVKVIDQGQRSTSSAYGSANAVTRSV